ncbi:hypothetical protein DSO57_1025556 [Entomophthora muscae]|nr:hypothetical protein DSO57_1025556 [Entomophthora muscae]
MFQAIVSGNIGIVNALRTHNDGRAKPAAKLISDPSSGTGFLNKNTFRHAVKTVNESRGNREGNTAFYKSTDRDSMQIHHTKYSTLNMESRALLDAISMGKLNQNFIPSLMAVSFDYSQTLTEYGVYEAASAGNMATVKMLLSLIGDSEGFNLLHKEVVQDKLAEKSLSSYRSNQVIKMATSNKQITPLHLAAIHPKSTYLDKFHDEISRADFSKEDGNGRTVAHFAAVADSSECLSFLINKGIAINTYDKLKVTPIMLCAMHGKHHNLQLFVDSLGRDVLNQKQSKFGWAPLHYAAHFGHEKAVLELLKLGASVDLQDKETKASSLHHASKMGHVETVKLLIQAGGANPELCDKFGRTPLHLACKNGWYDIAFYLLYEIGVDADAKDTSENTPLHYAAAYGWSDIVVLLDKLGGADLNAANNWKTPPMAIADMKGHSKIVNYFIANSDVKAAFRNQSGETLLHQYATEQPLNWYEANQLIDKAKCLVKREDASLSTKDIQGNTPLHKLASSPYYIKGGIEKPTYPAAHLNSERYATMEEGSVLFGQFDDESGTKVQLELASLCLENCSDIEVQNEAGFTPLEEAMNNRHIDFVIYLIKSAGADAAGSRYAEGSNIIHFFLNEVAMLQVEVTQCQDEDTVEAARINRFYTKVGTLWSTIHASLGDGSVSKLFATPNKQGCYPILSSLTKAYEEMKCQMRPSLTNNQITQGSSWNYLISVFEFLFSSFHPNLDAKRELPIGFLDDSPSFFSEPQMTGWSALHYAASINVVELVELLLKHGADPNIISDGHNDGFSPLHAAVYCLNKGSREDETVNQALEISLRLIKKGADMFCAPSTPPNKYGANSHQNIIYKDSAFIMIIKHCSMKTAEKLVQAYQEITDAASTAIYVSQQGNYEGSTPLIAAVQLDSVSKVQLVMSLNPSINIADNNGLTALMHVFCSSAPNRNQIAGLILKLAPPGSLDLDVMSKSGQTTLCFAGQAADSSLLNLLEEYIPPRLITVNTPDLQGKTPLYWACQHALPGLVKKLLAAGANPNIQVAGVSGVKCMTPLMAAIHHLAPNSLETVEVLLEAGAYLNATDSQGCTALHLAAVSQSYQIAKVLLEKGVAVNPEDDLGRTPLHLSILESLKQSDRTLRTETLLTSHNANINAQDYQGRTPLHFCFSTAGIIPYMRYTEQTKARAAKAQGSSQEIAQYEKKAEAQLSSLQLDNSLMYKCILESKALPSLKALEQAKQSQDELNWFKYSPYREPNWESEYTKDLKDDPIDLVSFFLGCPSADVNTVDYFGRTPLHYAARIGASTCTEYLLDKKANPNARDNDGLMPFHLSLLHGHIDYTNMMFKKGIEDLGPMQLPCKVNITPFCYALSNSYMPLAYLLVKKSTSFISTIKDTLHSGKLFLAFNLMKQASHDKLAETESVTHHNLAHAIAGFKPINLTAWHEYLPEYLAKIKAMNIPIDLPDNSWATPLILAVTNSQSTLALSLIDHCSSPDHLNRTDLQGRNALWHAINNSMEDVASKLLEKGVVVDNRTMAKHPSVLYLAVFNTPSLVEPLLRCRADPNIDAAYGRRSAFMRTLFSSFALDFSYCVILWKLLLDAGANINAEGPVNIWNIAQEPMWDLPPASEAKHVQNIHPMFLVKDLPLPTQAYFIRNGLRVDVHHPTEGRCFLSYAPSIESLKFYLLGGADINLINKHTGRSFLYELILEHPDLRDEDKLIEFLQLVASDVLLEVTAKDPVLALSPLEYAVQGNRLALICWLLAAGADPHFPTATQNPIILSLLHNKTKAVSCFLRHASKNAAWEKWIATDEYNRPYVLVQAVTLNNIASYRQTVLLRQILVSLQQAGHKIDILAHQTNRLMPSAISLAAIQFYQDLYQVFLEMGCQPPASMDVELARKSAAGPSSLNNANLLAEVDFIQDAKDAKASLIAWHNVNHKAEEREISEVEQIDPKSDLAQVGKLARGSKGELLSVLMNRTQVESAYQATNMFYKLQLIHNPIQDVFVLFTRWGDIRCPGMYQRTPFTHYDVGLKEFEAVFKAKSGNAWDCRHPETFVSRPGRYVITREFTSPQYMDSFEGWRKATLPKALPPSTLPFGMECLMRIFYQLTTMQHHDTSKYLSFSLCDAENVSKAHQLLLAIKDTLDEITNLSAPGVNFDAKSLSLVRHKLIELNSEYFTLIPHKSNFTGGLSPILSAHIWTKESLDLERLSYLHTGSNVLLAAIQKAKDISPLDYCYHVIGCQLQEVSQQDPWYSMVEQYMDQDGSTNFELAGLFRTRREEETANFCPFEASSGRKLLWHGSKVENYFGILSKGLRAAPIAAASTGYMFGKGIYFADVFKKSVNYSVSNSERSKGYRCLLLCEVAVGNPYSTLEGEFMLEPKDGFDSTKGVGLNCPNPDDSVYLVDGTEVPLGKLVKSTEAATLAGEKRMGDIYYSSGMLAHNEYVVYDHCRVKIRALVVVKEKKTCHLCLNPSTDLTLEGLLESPNSISLEYSQTSPLVPKSSFYRNCIEQILADMVLRQQGYTDPVEFIVKAGLPHLIMHSSHLFNQIFDPVVPFDPKTSKLCASCIRGIVNLAYQEYMLGNKDILPEPFKQRPDCWYGFKCKSQFSKSKLNQMHLAKYNHVCYPLEKYASVDSSHVKDH